MKFFLLLAIFFAVSNAAISLKYQIEPTLHAEFQMTSALLQNPLVRGQVNTLNICGVARSDIVATQVVYEVSFKSGEASQVFSSGTKNLPGTSLSRSVWRGSRFCYNIDFRVPTNFDDSQSGYYIRLVIWGDNSELTPYRVFLKQ